MPPLDAHPDHTRVRRRFAYALIGLVAILLLLITPPLVSLDRYRHRIAQSMSDSLGRPVHIDDVKLHLLPLPSLELRNVVVSEDPAFGAEPTIRANRVEAVLRTNSLWRRRIEFSTIRFAADENGAGPSINLVRNAAGRWNLDSVLMQAAHVPTAPTAQRRAGLAPRFPYIEAVSARVNLKLGDEKMPFSLTDAEFALWLPSPDQWHVRLQGRPTRTDASLSETGIVRLEGTLFRAASMAQVPVDLQANWTGAQLGEGTALLTGQDMGWRGTATFDASLRGPLADAQFTSTLALHSLRRTEFVPVSPLDLTVTCKAHATITEATFEHPVCSLPAPLTGNQEDTGQEESGKVQLEAARFDLTSRTADDLRFTIHASDSWLLDWARLLTARIPPTQSAQGTVEGSFAHIPAAAGQSGFWNGQLQGTVSGTLPWHKSDEGSATYAFLLQASPQGLDLEPISLALPSENPLSLRGTFDITGYTLHLLGLATPEQVQSLARLLPPFSGGFASVFPAHASGTANQAQPQRMDLTCTRAWSAAEQNCTTGHATADAPVHTRTSARARRGH